MEQKRSTWVDFITFCKDAGRSHLAEVTVTDCGAYIAFLQREGRYVKEMAYKRGGRRKQVSAVNWNNQLSSRSVGAYYGHVASIFQAFLEPAGLARNPMRAVPKPRADYVTRESYTEQECRDMLAATAHAFGNAIAVIVPAAI
jgi:hypothetical protein